RGMGGRAAACVGRPPGGVRLGGGGDRRGALRGRSDGGPHRVGPRRRATGGRDRDVGGSEGCFWISRAAGTAADESMNGSMSSGLRRRRAALCVQRNIPDIGRGGSVG